MPVDQTAKYAVAAIILIISLACMPICWEKRAHAARMLLPYENQNSGYEGIGKRLSMRFRESDPNSQQSLLKWKLQRELGTWSLFLGLCGLGAFGSVLYLSRPSWGWWQRKYEVMAKNWAKRRRLRQTKNRAKSK